MFHAVPALSGFAGIDLSGFAKVGSLLMLPFAHEDLAIILGGYIIVNKLMPAAVVAASIYGGIVASDFALYGLGAAARHLPWLRHYAVDERVNRFGEGLKRNVFGLVALCRVVPGIVFVAFVACGWTRVSLTRFAAASLAVSALYLPLMLWLVIVLGDALDDHVGFWAWPMLLIAITATNFARKRVFAWQDTAPAAQPPDFADESFGMPALARADRKVAAAERIPPTLFYLPLVFNWLWLAIRHRSMTLPSAANPNVFTGGMWGESKSSYLLDVAPAERQWIADFIVIQGGAGLADAQGQLAAAGIEFPLIAKPDIGWHGYGVRRIEDSAQLETYLASFPHDGALILQRYVPHPAEAAVLYARLPGETEGRILSLTFRYFPHVVGDGMRTLRELIRSDERAQWKSALHLGLERSHCGVEPDHLACVPRRGEAVRIAVIGNQRAGALYRDGRRHITAALEQRFDAIARSMNEFHYGRFDLRFETAEALMRGEEFSIVEINGIGGEAIDCWDPRLPVSEAYRRLAEQQRLLFLIGERNRARGFRPTSAFAFAMGLIRQTMLIRRYPASA